MGTFLTSYKGTFSKSRDRTETRTYTQEILNLNFTPIAQKYNTLS